MAFWFFFSSFFILSLSRSRSINYRSFHHRFNVWYATNTRSFHSQYWIFSAGSTIHFGWLLPWQCSIHFRFKHIFYTIFLLFLLFLRFSFICFARLFRVILSTDMIMISFLCSWFISFSLALYAVWIEARGTWDFQ